MRELLISYIPWSLPVLQAKVSPNNAHLEDMRLMSSSRIWLAVLKSVLRSVKNTRMLPLEARPPLSFLCWRSGDETTQRYCAETTVTSLWLCVINYLCNSITIPSHSATWSRRWCPEILDQYPFLADKLLFLITEIRFKNMLKIMAGELWVHVKSEWSPHIKV